MAGASGGIFGLLGLFIADMVLNFETLTRSACSHAHLGRHNMAGPQRSCQPACMHATPRACCSLTRSCPCHAALPCTGFRQAFTVVLCGIAGDYAQELVQDGLYVPH